jgi:hypothetical protein
MQPAAANGKIVMLDFLCRLVQGSKKWKIFIYDSKVQAALKNTVYCKSDVDH